MTSLYTNKKKHKHCKWLLKMVLKKLRSIESNLQKWYILYKVLWNPRCLLPAANVRRQLILGENWVPQQQGEHNFQIYSAAFTSHFHARYDTASTTNLEEAAVYTAPRNTWKTIPAADLSGSPQDNSLGGRKKRLSEGISTSRTSSCSTNFVVKT